MTLHLVRHGRPAVDPRRPAREWALDPAGYDDVWALRDRLPVGATWYCSSEPKAVETAQLLTDAPVPVVPALDEHRRGAGLVEDFAGTVRAAFERPDLPAAPGWKPLLACRDRVTAAVEAVLEAHPEDDVVLVGHGTAWTLVVAHLQGTSPDLDRWAALCLPDLISLDRP